MSERPSGGQAAGVDDLHAVGGALAQVLLLPERPAASPPISQKGAKYCSDSVSAENVPTTSDMRSAVAMPGGPSPQPARPAQLPEDDAQVGEEEHHRERPELGRDVEVGVVDDDERLRARRAAGRLEEVVLEVSRADSEQRMLDREPRGRAERLEPLDTFALRDFLSSLVSPVSIRFCFTW